MSKFLVRKWVKDIWNFKEETGLENCKSLHVEAFPCMNVCQNIFKHHDT